MGEIILRYTRGGHTENIHLGDVAVVDTAGNLTDSVGDAYLPMFWRSAAKPFQALPFVKDGGMEKYGITAEELALLVSSHSGEENHVRLVTGILAKLGLTPDALDCGAARPMSGKAFSALIKSGQKPQAVHNPCSGKHSQILALSQMLNIPIEGYIKPEHEAQKIIRRHIAMATRLNEDEVEIGIDGCGVPVFYLPLFNMALAYARLADPQKGAWGEYERAATQIIEAMAAYPQVLSGTGRIDAEVGKITNGRIVAKIGADAVYCLAIRDKAWGVAFKIEDGSYAAVTPAVIAVLKRLKVLTAKEENYLDEKFPPLLKNHRGDIIGTIEYDICRDCGEHRA